MLLCLAAMAQGGEVMICRGELVEIGGGFRIPDMLAQSGARLVEVGTTNRTRLADYERALHGARHARVLRVHQSNFRVVGFTEQPELGALAALAAERGRAADRRPRLRAAARPARPAGRAHGARARCEAGAALVCFSGDKLLGGPQAGIVVGRRAAAVERVRRHPLQRALRIDKLSLAGAGGDAAALPRPCPGGAPRSPSWPWRREPVEAVQARAAALAERLGGTVVESTARIGGGAVPLLELPSAACALAGGEATRGAPAGGRSAGDRAHPRGRRCCSTAAR